MKLTNLYHVLVFGLFAIPSEETNGTKFSIANYGCKASKLSKPSSCLNKVDNSNGKNGSLLHKGRYKTTDFNNNNNNNNKELAPKFIFGVMCERRIPTLSNFMSFQHEKLNDSAALKTLVPKVEKKPNQTNRKLQYSYLKEELVSQEAEIEKENQERRNMFLSLGELDEDDALAIICSDFLSKAP